MNFKYTTTILMLLMILALSRGVVLHYQDLIHFDAITAHAEGDGGDGGSAGAGAGDGGSAGAGAGDGGSAGAGAGDGTSAGAGAGTSAPSGDVGGGGGIVPVYGCMDFTATNYNPSATSQTGVTCTYTVIVYGCMDSTATNYNPSATSQTGITCTYPVIIYGCMDSTATNYNSHATSQTGITCTYPAVPVYGCMDSTATNYKPSATVDDWSCMYPAAPIYGCMDSTATNYDASATSQTGITCTYVVVIYGCMDSTATNYNSHATSQTGITCTYPAVPVYGCTDSSATNYNPSATIDDWSCFYPPAIIYGCMDSTATNYNASATSQTGVTCTYVVVIYGCMDSTATNYNPSATSQTGITCTYTPTCILSANPSAIQTGDSSTLHWTTSYATSFSINQSIGSVSPVSAGSKGITPAVTTTYTGTATGAGGSVICAATVTVTALPPVIVYGCMDSTATNYDASATSQTGITCTYTPTCILTANPTAIQIGDSSTLHWTTSNATSFSINQGIGAVSPVAIGSKGITPAVTTTYTGTATGPGGSVICAAAVTVTALPPVIVYGCMDSTATNYNPSATNQTGIICTYPVVPVAPACVLTATPTSVTTGSTSTLSWTTTNATSFSINQSIGNVTPVSSGSTTTPAINADTTFTGTATNSAGSTVSCTATVTVTALPSTPSTSSSGGSHRGSSRAPGITLAMLPHVGVQPLAYLYLSQIPQTGLDLGPLGTLVYWLVLISVAFALAYFVLFGAAPMVNRSLRNFGSRVSLALNAQTLAPVYATHEVTPAPVQHEAPEVFAEAPEATRGYSSYDGFKSFAQGGALSIEDLVKGLSREHSIRAAEQTIAPAVVQAPAPYVEPIYEHVEPMYQETAPTAVAPQGGTPAHIRGFTAALIEGDRVAVFAGLRQHVRGSGAPEELITSTVCLLDDVYRARIDGSACDPDIARMAARLNTGTLENLIASLTTAIDSSYSTGVTGAKLALTRALVILGA